MVGPSKGCKVTWGKKISKAKKRLFKEGKLVIWNKGKPNPVRSRLNKERKGIFKHSEKTKQLMSQQGIGNKNKFYGKNHSDLTKKKMSDLRKKWYKIHKHPLLGKHHSVKSRQKISLHHADFSGERHPQWLGGKSFEPYSWDYYKVRNSILERDGFTCQLCQDKILTFSKKQFITVHHIDYNKKNNAPSNLISLCNFCNSSVNTKREEWTKIFKDKIGDIIGAHN